MSDVRPEIAEESTVFHLFSMITLRIVNQVGGLSD